jgi:hypothetical protein
VQQCENLPQKDAMLPFRLLNFEILPRSTSSLNQDSAGSWSSHGKRLVADLSLQRLRFQSRPVCGISGGQSVIGVCFCPSTYCFPYLFKYLLTSWSRVPLEKLTVCQLVKKFLAFMEPECTLPHSEVPATCPYLDPARSSSYPHIPLTEYPS